MEEKTNQRKKVWAQPTCVLISSGNINNGAHPTFAEISKTGPQTYRIIKNTPLHKTYHTSSAGWNFAGHS